METIIFSSLIASTLSIKCSWQTPSMRLQQEGWPLPSVIWPGFELPLLTECGFFLDQETGIDLTDQMVCSTTKFEGSYNREARNWFTGEEYQTTWNYESDVKSCNLKAVCNNLAGSTNGCKYAEYEYTKWQPRSCNATAIVPYDAVTEDFSAKLTLSCCDDSDYCNSGSGQYDDCTEAPGFKEYINSLNTCWNDLKVDFFTDSVCDGDLFDGDIINWSNNCTEEDGSWIAALRDDKDCQYRISCAPEMQQQLKKFAECSCDAAASNGYSGDFIATAMETVWSRFCPNIEISCAISENLQEATSKLIYKYFRVSYPILIGLYASEITDAVEEIIFNTVADALNIDSDLITLEITTFMVLRVRRLRLLSMW